MRLNVVRKCGTHLINIIKWCEYGIELFGTNRKPKVIISVTMYNESFKELNDSLRGIADNIENLPEYSYGLTVDDIVVFVIIFYLKNRKKKNKK